MGIIRRNGGPQTFVIHGVKSLLGDDINPALTIEAFRGRVFVRLFSSYHPHETSEDKRVIEVISLDRKYSAFYTKTYLRRFDRRNNPFWDEHGDPTELGEDRRNYIRENLNELGLLICRSLDSCHLDTLKARFEAFGVTVPVPTLSYDLNVIPNQMPLGATI